MLMWVMNLDFAASATVTVVVEGGEMFLTFPWIWDELGIAN